MYVCGKAGMHLHLRKVPVVTCMYMCMETHTCMHTHTHTDMHTHTFTCMHAHIHTHMQTHTHTRTLTPQKPLEAGHS